MKCARCGDSRDVHHFRLADLWLCATCHREILTQWWIWFQQEEGHQDA
jgi:DNA-directed RNA polymerase subunit RPC12/RpoP